MNFSRHVSNFLSETDIGRQQVLEIAIKVGNADFKTKNEKSFGQRKLTLNSKRTNFLRLNIVQRHLTGKVFSVAQESNKEDLKNLLAACIDTEIVCKSSQQPLIPSLVGSRQGVNF